MDLFQLFFSSSFSIFFLKTSIYTPCRGHCKHALSTFLQFLSILSLFSFLPHCIRSSFASLVFVFWAIVSIILNYISIYTLVIFYPSRLVGESLVHQSALLHFYATRTLFIISNVWIGNWKAVKSLLFHPRCHSINCYYFFSFESREMLRSRYWLWF